jgi:hypothetical protein
VTGDASAIGDAVWIHALLVEAAREGYAISYAGLLGRLGLGFTRPKMRALCRTLDLIDREAGAAGEPELAVLVVRASDGLPGQGWWTGHARETGYAGPWLGAPAMREVERLQQAAFRFWQDRG